MFSPRSGELSPLCLVQVPGISTQGSLGQMQTLLGSACYTLELTTVCGVCLFRKQQGEHQPLSRKRWGRSRQAWGGAWVLALDTCYTVQNLGLLYGFALFDREVQPIIR